MLSGRSDFWKLGLSLADKRPWFGYGFATGDGLLRPYSWMFPEAQGASFHSTYITMVVETGWVGLVTISSVFLVCAIDGFRKLQKRSLLTRQELVIRAVPWAMTLGALAHAGFETWLFSAGNANALLFWICFWRMLQGKN